MFTAGRSCIHTYYDRYKANDYFRVRYFGTGIYNDIRRRLLKYYVSDIKDGLTYRTIPSTIYIFFTNLLPAIAFAQDMFDHTNNSYGVNEVLLASAMGGIVFGVLSGSPLCIVGVTGPVSIFNYTVYEIIEPMNIPYFQFMCWICLWSMGFHFILAFTNSVNFMRFVTKFSCDVFGFFINIVYIQKGIQILTHQFELADPASAFASIVVALVMTIFGVSSQFFGSKSHYLPPRIRTFIRDYSVPLCVVFFTGFIHFGGYLDDIKFTTLPITKSFHPTDTVNRRPDWFIRFWEDIRVRDVFLAVPFAILLTALFYYDHNISSLICQSSKFPLKKPSSFHYDFFLLGVTTGVAGLIGIPAPNGLIPQAPLHTHSLCVYEHDYETGLNKITRVVEQRLSNTFQGLLTLVMMTRPFLVVLGLIPQAILAGLFWIMAITTLDDTDVVRRLRFLFLDKEWKLKLSKIIIPADYPIEYYLVRSKYFIIYLILELLAFAGEYSITCTKGAIGFPGVLMLILLLVPIVFPRIFPKDQLDLLDSEAADELIMRSLKLSSFNFD
ncbi:hypothetical protein PICMEDRAFT_37624 [Pichia membranifaciens NRRL Y-2026]|uniref:Bicarbonate transporter-like transmembrane domain-containing protein n=1 Tax=Pichia membranifaciens NRRL Y-2026 TaxID=763406 RepID=A0A1E3NFP0_9ASCO|nr:hypothetical protein PICMEDRAFT_37624 [Pichia membranifaciens NRRL Y-2026]ODQ44163.1 hypothetical protein PICMEDRAFT_37624 [Pichia membranifaciens NRRL Y-2026]